MEHPVNRFTLKTGEEQVLPMRCGECGGTIDKGRELVADGKRFLCEGCYRLLIQPSGEGNIPSRWGA